MASPPPNAIHPLSRAEWREWLLESHARFRGIWLVSCKKGAGKPRFDTSESVEEALCFGWIDSQPNKLDDQRSMLWFAPRKGRSGWSRPNKERVERLIEAGLMQPAGLAKVLSGTGLIGALVLSGIAAIPRSPWRWFALGEMGFALVLLTGLVML